MMGTALRLPVVKGIRHILSTSCIHFPQTDTNFWLFTMNEDHGLKPSSEGPPASREATPGESSVRVLVRSLSTSANNIIAASDTSFIQSQPRGRFGQALRKFEKNVTKKVSVRRIEC
jgi:hypothetical protein